MNEIPVIIVGVLAVFVVYELAIVWVFKTFMHIVRPDELLVLMGRTHTRKDGSQVGYRYLAGEGRVMRFPMLEEADRLSLRAVPVETKTVQTAEGPRRVHAVVAVSTDPDLIDRAIERFLGSEPEIPVVAQNTLRRHLESGADPATFRSTVDPILNKLGLTALSAQVAP